MSYELTPQQTRECQELSLEMFKFFHEFCKKHSLKHFVAGGCLIGAARDKKFIPWDDDVDVFMPREDYEKLIEIWNKESGSDRYILQVSKKGDLTKNLFATINDSETTFIKTYQDDLDINHGIVLDILPIDGCPVSKFKQLFQGICALVYALYLIGEAPLNNGKLIEIIGRIMLFLLPSKSLRWKVASWCEKQMKKYPLGSTPFAKELVSGPRYIFRMLYSEDFREMDYLEFEDTRVPVMNGYDRYLKIAFGDYMTPPPPEGQVCHHELTYVDTKNSYKKYRGIYYFLGDKK